MVVAWHGEPGLKAAAMERLREHRRLDEITQGQYFVDGRGCHLGCLTHDNDDAYEAAERLFGIEWDIAYWLESVFEGLPKSMCAAWVLDATEAIPVGADLSGCSDKMRPWLGIVGDTIPYQIGTFITSLRIKAVWWRGEEEETYTDAHARVWSQIAAKSIELFRAAPIVTPQPIAAEVRAELCCKRLWCPDVVVSA